MVDDFSEALAHLLSLLESALSEPVSLFEVLLSEGSCKGQHNSKIDPRSQKRSGSLSWLTLVPFYSEFSMVVFLSEGELGRSGLSGISLQTMKGKFPLRLFQDITDHPDLCPAKSISHSLPLPLL